MSPRRPIHALGASALIVTLACAVSACQSGKAHALESRSSPFTAGSPVSFVGTEPAKPLDETPITPLETVAARD